MTILPVYVYTIVYLSSFSVLFLLRKKVCHKKFAQKGSHQAMHFRNVSLLSSA